MRSATHRLTAIALALLASACDCACDATPNPAASAPLSAANAQTYQAICASCHARPGIGAPLTGVAADWRLRRERGMDALLVNTVDGVGGMPPLGSCGLCSADDFRALIRYMAGIP